jgi:outer membrane protein OmpA-like peptidoglycan-associated protein
MDSGFKSHIRDGRGGFHRAVSKRLSALSLVATCVLIASSTASASPLPLNVLGSLSASVGLSTPPTATVLLTASTSGSSYPSGTPNSSEPSGDAPPSSSSLPGYKESYVNDFAGATLPAGWSSFTGTPGADPGAQWAASHVVVGNGLLQLNAWRDPDFNNEWVTGGVCQCGLDQTYGAYFVRSKMTGPGATQVELLWPAQGWPPEVDFSETYGPTNITMATLHFSSGNDEVHQSLTIDMTQWHTWGVIWSPTQISYLVDGKVWATENVASEIPSQPMTLDLQQQTWCASNYACPTSDVSTDVDWVAEYTPAARDTVTVGRFAERSTTLSTHLRRQVVQLARTIVANGDSSVNLVGYGDSTATPAASRQESRGRAVAVGLYLKQVLSTMGTTSVRIAATANSDVPLLNPADESLSREVSASLS